MPKKFTCIVRDLKSIILLTLFAILTHPIFLPVESFAATSYLNLTNYYAYETFSTSGTWTRPYGVSQIDYLVVAGGGRGGGSQASSHYAGGGGGGGGVRYGTLSVAQSSYTITVGTGQTIGCSSGRGGNSSISGADITTVTSTGGGSGSCNQNTGDGAGGIDANSGGSGGGGGAQTYSKLNGSGNAGSFSPVEGYSGGTAYPHGSDGTKQGGGGGGGATQAGENATIGCAGKGGDGYTSSITGTAVVYGGGGGGGTRSNSCGGGAGAGGGGAGGLYGAQGSAGTNGRGGGGGGTALANGNRGGDGVVIVRYLVSKPTTPNLATVNDSGASNSDDITSATTFTLTGSATGGASIQIYDGSTSVGSPCTANITTGTYSCALSAVTEGTHSYTAKASYGGGTENASDAALTVVVDITAPSLTIKTHSVSVAEGNSSSQTLGANETVTFGFNGVYDSAQFSLNSSTGLLSFSSHDYEIPLDSDLNNQYYASISVTDTAGNRSSTYNFFYTVTNVVEPATLGTLSLSAQPKKGTPITLSVTSDVSGKVTFFANGKRIARCISISTTGTSPNFSGQCIWKPTSTAPVTLYASITSPTGIFATTVTSSVATIPGVRAGARNG